MKLFLIVSRFQVYLFVWDGLRFVFVASFSVAMPQGMFVALHHFLFDTYSAIILSASNEMIFLTSTHCSDQNSNACKLRSLSISSTVHRQYNYQRERFETRKVPSFRTMIIMCMIRRVVAKFYFYFVHRAGGVSSHESRRQRTRPAHLNALPTMSAIRIT